MAPGGPCIPQATVTWKLLFKMKKSVHGGTTRISPHSNDSLSKAIIPSTGCTGISTCWCRRRRPVRPLSSVPTCCQKQGFQGSLPGMDNPSPEHRRTLPLQMWHRARRLTPQTPGSGQLDPQPARKMITAYHKVHLQLLQLHEVKTYLQILCSSGSIFTFTGQREETRIQRRVQHGKDPTKPGTLWIHVS